MKPDFPCVVVIAHYGLFVRPGARDMNEHEEIAKTLKKRLSELRMHLAKVCGESHKRLAADSEEQAIELVRVLAPHSREEA
jgi:hypothetical protein